MYNALSVSSDGAAGKKSASDNRAADHRFSPSNTPKFFPGQENYIIVDGLLTTGTMAKTG